MALDMPLRKTNTGQKVYLFQTRNMIKKSPNIKNIKTTPFMHALKKVLTGIETQTRTSLI